MAVLKDLCAVEYGKGLPQRNRIPGVAIVLGSAGVVGTHKEALYNEPIIVVGRKGNISGVHKIDGPSWVIDTAYAIKAGKNIDRDYLYYFLKYNTAHLAASDQSTAIPSLAREVIYDLPINLPKIEKQIQIVERIESLFSEIDSGAKELENAKQKLEVYRHSILSAAIQSKLVPQDPKDEPASKLLEKIRTEKESLIKAGKIRKQKTHAPIDPSEIRFKLPEGWEWARLGELFRFIDYRGKNPPRSESGLRIITARNIRKGFIRNEPVEYLSEVTFNKWMTRGFPQKGDILFITEGHTMGFVAIVDLDFPFALAQRTICLQPHLYGYSTYVSFYLSSLHFQNILRNLATGSAAQGIKAATLKTQLVPMPPRQEIARICETAETLIASGVRTLECAESQVSRIIELKQSILKKAFEGELN